MKSVYTPSKDVWVVYVGEGEEIAVVDREHPYAREILASRDVQFNSRRFGHLLNKLVEREAVLFGLELLLTQEPRKTRVKATVDKERLLDDYRRLYASYLEQAKQYNGLDFYMEPPEEISYLDVDEIIQVTREARDKLEELSTLLETYSAAKLALQGVDEEVDLKEIEAKLSACWPKYVSTVERTASRKRGDEVTIDKSELAEFEEEKSTQERERELLIAFTRSSSLLEGFDISDAASRVTWKTIRSFLLQDAETIERESPKIASTIRDKVKLYDHLLSKVPE